MKKILALLALYFLLQAFCYGQSKELQSPKTLQEFFNKHLSAINSGDASQFEEKFESIIGEGVVLEGEHEGWVSKAQLLLDAAGPRFYKFSSDKLIDTLLFRYTQDLRGQNSNSLAACRQVFKEKDVSIGHWPIEQAWDYHPRIDADYSSVRNYTRPGWGEAEREIYREIVNYNPSPQGGQYYQFPDSIATRVLDKISDEHKQVELLLFYLGKLLDQYEPIRTIQIIEGGLPQGIYDLILKSSILRDTSKATYMLTLAKLSADLLDKSFSAYCVSGIGGYLKTSFYDDADLVNKVVRYQVVRSKLYYEQLGLEGVDGAEIETDKLSRIARDFKDLYHVFEADYLNSFNGRTRAWINKSDPVIGKTPEMISQYYLKSLVSALVSKQHVFHERDRFYINEVVYSIAKYRNLAREREQILLESAYLVEKYSRTYSKSQKNQLFLRFVRFFGDFGEVASLKGLRSLNVSVVKDRPIDLFSFTLPTYRTPYRLTLEELDEKSEEVYQKYRQLDFPFPSVIVTYYLDPLVDYARSMNMDRYAFEMIEGEVRYAAKKTGDKIFQGDFLYDRQNRSFESLMAGKAQSEGRAKVKEQDLNKVIDNQGQLLLHLNKQIKLSERRLKEKLNELDRVSSLNDSISSENVNLAYDNQKISFENDSLNDRNEGLWSKNQDLSNKVFLKMQEVYYQWFVIGALLLFLATAIWQFTRAKKAKLRAIESEKRERIQAFTISQIGHLGPDVIEKVRNDFRIQGDDQRLKSLQTLLHTIHRKYHSEKIFFWEEMLIINEYVDLKFSHDGTKYPHDCIELEIPDNSDFVMPTFVLLNIVTNAFKYGLKDLREQFVKIRFEDDKGFYRVVVSNSTINAGNTGGFSTGFKFINEILQYWNKDSSYQVNTKYYDGQYISQYKFSKRPA